MSKHDLIPHPFVLSLMKQLAIRLSPQAGKSLVMSKHELIQNPFVLSPSKHDLF